MGSIFLPMFVQDVGGRVSGRAVAYGNMSSVWTTGQGTGPFQRDGALRRALRTTSLRAFPLGAASESQRVFYNSFPNMKKQMDMRRLRWGMIGGGSNSFFGIVHRVASYMTEQYKLLGGVFGSDRQESLRFGKTLFIEENRIYGSVDEMIQKESKKAEGERIEVVTIVTPNFLHFKNAGQLLRAGYHVICEKPLTLTLSEALELQRLAEKGNRVFCVAHTYTGYPMVRQAREMVRGGLLGNIFRVDVQYYQGWVNEFIHDGEKRKTKWRLNPAVSGPTSCCGDIGVHAFNLIEYVTTLQLESLLADLNTLYKDNPLDLDGTILLRFKGDARGVIRMSQIATGEENNLTLAIYGRKASLKWQQEIPFHLTYMQEGKPVETLKMGNSYLSDPARESSRIAPGHPEGVMDAMSNLYQSVSDAILRSTKQPYAYPDVSDGVRGMRFIEATLRSSGNDAEWVSFEP